MKHILELVHIVQRTRVHCLEGGGRGEGGREEGREGGEDNTRQGDRRNRK